MKFAKFLEKLFYRTLLVNASAYPVTASVFIDKVIKQHPIKLKIGMLDHMNNAFRNTVFQISVDVMPLILNFIVNRFTFKS